MTSGSRISAPAAGAPAALAPGLDEGAFPEFVAAVDLGSNSFHMKVARVVGGELQVVDRMRETVRLAAGLDAANRITGEAAERALHCLGRFGQRLRDLPSGNVRVVGTNTFRRARGSGAFFAEAESALGHPVEILDGREEARLIYLGVSQGIAADERQRLVVDIGGGSTELIIGRRFTPLHTESLYMGCVSLSLTHFAGGRIRRTSVRAAELEAARELDPIRARYRKAGWDAAFGASGTVRAIDRAIRELGWSSGGITREALRRLRDALAGAGHVEALGSLGVETARAAVFPGGVAILCAVFDTLGIRRMSAAEGALREGVLHDLIGRFRHHDVRDATIGNLSRRFRIDTGQAARVERSALCLYRQVARAWRLRKPRYRDWLSWAARLHEVGLDVAHNQYHKHGAYLLEHATCRASRARTSRRSRSWCAPTAASSRPAPSMRWSRAGRSACGISRSCCGSRCCCTAGAPAPAFPASMRRPARASCASRSRRAGWKRTRSPAPSSARRRSIWPRRVSGCAATESPASFPCISVPPSRATPRRSARSTTRASKSASRPWRPSRAPRKSGAGGWAGGARATR